MSKLNELADAWERREAAKEELKASEDLFIQLQNQVIVRQEIPQGEAVTLVTEDGEEGESLITIKRHHGGNLEFVKSKAVIR